MATRTVSTCDKCGDEIVPIAGTTTMWNAINPMGTRQGEVCDPCMRELIRSFETLMKAGKPDQQP